MTKNEKRFLTGFAVLGVLTMMAAMALTGALFMSTRAASGQSPAHTVSAGSPIISQMIKDVTAPIEQNARSAAPVSGEKAVPAAPESPRKSLPLSAPQVTGGVDLTNLYDQTNPGVVSIEVESTVQNPFGQGDFQQRGQGSGFVYGEHHIVTNRHVVEGARTVEIAFFDGERREGKVLGTDEFSDLAVVEVADMPATARKLPLVVDFQKLDVGMPVIAIGNPFGNANSMTYGIISALGRTIPANGQGGGYSIPQTIQTDAAINPGNSGGPLLDLQGEVIGVNAQINTVSTGRGGTPGNSGVGFAIPASIVARVAPTLIQNGQYEWSFLGIKGQQITLDLAKANKLTSTRGAYVSSVVATGPSVGKLRGASNVPNEEAAAPSEQDNEQDRGGFLIPIQPGQAPEVDVVPQGGDIITAVDGKQIGTFEDLLTYIALDTRPGQTVRLTVLRDGQTQDVEVQVQARPHSPTSARE